ncbi:MAG: hypothetical protein WBN40_11715, partial [Pseudomonadales bacterium]
MPRAIAAIKHSLRIITGCVACGTALLAAPALGFDVEANSIDNEIYILLINDNPATSYESISIDNVPPGLVSSASASIVPASVAAGGSDLAAVNFSVDAAAALGATGNLSLTVSGTVGGQAVDVELTVPLEVVSSADAAQGFVGSTIPSPDPGGVDSDGDGVSDALEIAFGASPLDSESLPGQAGAT